VFSAELVGGEKVNIQLCYVKWFIPVVCENIILDINDIR